MKAAENRSRPAGAAKPRSLVSSSRRVPAPPAWPGPRALCVERVAGGGERWKRRSLRPVPAGLPGAAGERLARLQLPQQVLPAVLRDQPPCAPAELEREADGDAARGVVARTFTWAVSAYAFFFPGPSRGFFAVCPRDFVVGVCGT